MHNTKNVYLLQPFRCKKDQILNRFFRVSPEITAQYGFISNLILFYLKSKADPSFSCKSFAHLIDLYYCPKSISDCINLLQEEGLLVRTVKTLELRKYTSYQSVSSLCITKKGLDFVGAHFDGAILVEHGLAKAFEGNYEHAYYFTLMRDRLPRSFTRELSELCDTLNTTLSPLKRFLTKAQHLGAITKTSPTKRGVTPTYIQQKDFFFYCPTPLYNSYRIINNHNESIGFQPATFTQNVKNTYMPSEMRMKISSIYDFFTEPDTISMKLIARLAFALKRRFSDGKIGLSKPLFHNVISLGLTQALSAGYTQQAYLRGLCAYVQRKDCTKKTVDLKEVFLIMSQARNLDTRLNYVRQDMRGHQNDRASQQAFMRASLCEHMSQKMLATLSFTCIAETLEEQNQKVMESLFDKEDMNRARYIDYVTKRQPAAQLLRTSLKGGYKLDAQLLYSAVGSDEALYKVFSEHARYKHLVIGTYEVITLTSFVSYKDTLAYQEQQQQEDKEAALAAQKQSYAQMPYNPCFSQEAADLEHSYVHLGAHEQTKRASSFKSLSSVFQSLQSRFDDEAAPKALDWREMAQREMQQHAATQDVPSAVTIDQGSSAATVVHADGYSDADLEDMPSYRREMILAQRRLEG